MPNQLELVLDSVSDAVSAIVLFASESDERNTPMPNLVAGVDGLSKAVNFLVGLGRKSAGFWANIGRFDMQESMNKTGDSIDESTKNLTIAVKDLAEFPNHKPSKKALLRTCKEIMTNTVTLVQLSDLYDVQKLIREANNSGRAAKTLAETKSVHTGFINNATDFVQTSAEVARLCYKRIGVIESGDISRRLLASGDTIKSETEKLLSATKDAVLNPRDQDKIDDANRKLKFFLDTLNQIIADARLTARSPFDLSMLDGAEFIDYSLTTTGFIPDEDIIMGHQAVAAAMERFLFALKSGNESLIEEARRSLQEELLKQSQNAKAIAQGCDDSETRRKLEAASLRIQNNLEALLLKARQAALNQDFSELENLMNSTRAASAFVVQHGAKGLMLQSEAKLAAALEELEYAVKRGNNKTAVGNLKEVAKEINLQADIAKCIADGDSKDMDELRKVKIRQEASNLESMTAQLISASKKGLADIEDIAALRHLAEKAAETKEISHSLVSMSIMSPQAELLEGAGILQEQLKQAATLISAPTVSTVELAKIVKAITKSAIRQTELAEQISERAPDGFRKQLIANANEGLRRQATLVVAATKSVIANEPGAASRMGMVLESTGTANMKLVQATALHPDDQMIELEAEILSRMDHLNTAVKEGTDEEVALALAAVQRSLAKQKLLARAISETIDDGMQKKQIENALKEIENAANELPAHIAMVRAQPGNKLHYDKFQKTMNEIREGVGKVTQATSSSLQERLLQNARKFHAQAQQLKSAIDKNQDPESRATLASLKHSLAMHSQLGRALADSYPLQKREIINAAGEIDRIYPELEEAVKFALIHPGDKLAKEKVASILRDAQKEVSNIIALTQANAEQAILENGRDLDSELDRLVRAVKRGDEPESYVVLKHALNKLAQQSLLGQVVADNCGDKVLCEKLLKNTAEIDKLCEDLEHAVKRALNNPAEVPELQRIVDDLKKKNAELMQLSKQSVEIKEQRKREEAERVKREQEEKIRREEERKRQEEERKRQEEERKIREEHERIEAERKRIAKLEKEKAEIARIEFEKAETERKRKQELEKIEAERIERLEREAAERRKKEEEDAARDEVEMAAQAMMRRAEQARQKLGFEFPEFTGEGRLVDLARQIGELMRLMSLAAKANNKAEMIRIAQQIAAMVKNIIVQATEQAEKCTDPILKTNLITAAQSVSSFAIQLKIIAAVKAATEGDKSAKTQLIKCAQGISNAVINTVNAAEIAAIRSRDRKK